jgi:hypothetical protein
MKANANASGVQGATAEKGAANKILNRPSLTGKEAKQDEKTNDQKPAEAPKGEEAKAAEVKTGNPAAVDNQPANLAGQQKPEVNAGEPKAEVKYIKPVPNLEATIKAVDTLHRRTIQRVNLITRIKQLETPLRVAS